MSTTSSEYIVVICLEGPGACLTLGHARDAERVLAAEGHRVAFRHPRAHEREGAYVRGRDGALERLDYAEEIPEALGRAFDVAAALALATGEEL